MGRASMIGDNLAALPTARLVKKYDLNSHITWAIGKKSSSFAPLLLNHPDLDSIFITDGYEGLESKNDFNKFNSCNHRLDLNPQHPDSIYPSQRNIYLESFLMAGFSEDQWTLLTEEEKIPKLVKWWSPVKKLFGDRKTIFFTGMPNFGKESKRWVTKKYLENLIEILINLDYCVIQSGGEQDESWFSNWNLSDSFKNKLKTNYIRINEKSFFEQIQIANECDLIIGSDSGMSLVCGAYRLNQISLTPIHWGNDNNPTALSTNNPNNYSFYSHGGNDNIDINLVIDKIKEKLS
jgi:ADP-heptose:LPS heptosyltransferase